MQEWEWLAYGIDIEDIVVKTEGNNIHESHLAAVSFLDKNKIEFDTCELYDENSKRRQKLFDDGINLNTVDDSLDDVDVWK